MRYVLLIICVFLAQQANANLTALIKAVKANDIDLVVEILEQKNEYGLPFSINDVDDDKRPAIFYVSSPEMLTLLLARGAELYQLDLREAHQPRVDSNGMNALHVLMAETAPRLFEEIPEQAEEIRRRIEATAYFLMRLSVLREYTGRGKIRLETHPDNYSRLPADFVEGCGPFIDRLNNRHLRQYRPVPEGGFMAQRQRREEQEHRLRAELERQLAEERRIEDEMRQRHEARMQAILDAELTDVTQPPAARLVAPVLRLIAPRPRRPGLEGRRNILQGPQWWIDQQNAGGNSNNN